MRVHITGVLAGAVLALALITPSESDAALRCEASALTGTVLGQAVEPVTANKGEAACKTATGSGGLALPAPLSANVLGAATELAGTGTSAVGTATGGLADVRVTLAPNLLSQLPLQSLVQNVPAITVPLVGSVDLKPAVMDLLTSQSIDLLRLQGATAFARASCANGRAALTSASSTAGLKLLGADTPLNGVVEQGLTAVGGGAIDPSQLDIAKLGLPTGVTLDPATTGLIQTALDALPAIQIPAAVANVRITPGAETRSGGVLTRSAVRIEVGLLGRSLADLTIGQARVALGDDSCAVAAQAPVADAALRCTSRRLVLIDVLERAGRVRLYGAADRKYVGRKIPIYFKATGRRVATAVVRKDGTFSTTAPLPRGRLRTSNRARYTAKIGFNESLPLKLHRRMIVSRVHVSGGRVRITGFIRRPLATPARPIKVKQRVSCSKSVTVGTVRPSRSGRFSIVLKAPRKQQAGTYRLSTWVRRNETNPKVYPTFTLPRYVDLG